MNKFGKTCTLAVCLIFLLAGCLVNKSHTYYEVVTVPIGINYEQFKPFLPGFKYVILDVEGQELSISLIKKDLNRSLKEHGREVSSIKKIGNYEPAFVVNGVEYKVDTITAKSF